MFLRKILILTLLEIVPSLAVCGTYSRAATKIPLMCEARHCPAVVVVRSPDGSKEVRSTLTVEEGFKFPNLEVRTKKEKWDLPIGQALAPWVDVDVLWSPDSQFIALSGNINGQMSFMRVLRIDNSGPVEIDVVREAFQDMLGRFPPSRARSYLDPDLREEIPQHEDYLNFSAIDWTDAHTLVVMSEVPCESRWGGIMCQVMGYEVDALSGKILRAMTAAEFKKKWQHAMPFRFHVPDPPEWKN